jgi:tetratricopeptide (TPR) repeat protein
LLITLTVAAIVVYGSGSSTDQILVTFPLNDLATRLTTFNLQAVALAFTAYIFTTSMTLTLMSLLPLPGQDGFMMIASLLAFFREKNEVGPGTGRPASQFRQNIMVSQHRRRNQAAEIHFKTGAEYHEQEQYEDAIARYRQAIGNDANFGPAYINMGLAYLAKNDRRKAIQAFRGATQMADDQRSQTEAWHQLQELSEVVPIDPEETRLAMAEMGATPWTDTKARPNWWALLGGTLFLLIVALGFYSYLVIRLIDLVRS